MDRKDIELPANYPCLPLYSKHAEYLESWDKSKESLEYVLSEYLRMSGLYWSLTALCLLDKQDILDKAAVLEYIDRCYDKDQGGFAAAPGNDCHLLYTLSAVQILCIYDAVEPRHVDGAVRFITSLQQADGSFVGDRWGEIDTRFSFCAVACLSLLKRLDAVHVDRAASHVVGCMNFDGGFGVGPLSESHAGQIFCCVGALTILGQLHRVDDELLGWWLCERQLPSGGFNGRPEKLPDVCYSWWVLSALSCLGKLHWIDRPKLEQFILACQDDETGGFADRPGDMVDPFHTLFGIAALSLLGDKDVQPVNPVFCMPQSVIDRVLGEDQPKWIK
eukprot:TRINITY_DN7664_c1_g2_i1.p1 TRINITY_DN7664_c1_g2~~TRINITY_DN7664_c1_g2_i1.p1  ORF type:complete len:333 (+),score=31.95 TRINITY_DN7664_c1_g2_i1:85-1083(+)